jgi:hypothetical protein
VTCPLASERLRRLVTERSRADQTAVTLESVLLAEAAPPGTAEVTAGSSRPSDAWRSGRTSTTETSAGRWICGCAACDQSGLR